MALSRDEIAQIAKASAQTILEGLHHYAVEYKEPESVVEGLRDSMIEESTAADWYRKRFEHAREMDDPKTADVYDHIAREEDSHYDEFKERLQEIEGAGVVERCGGNAEPAMRTKQHIHPIEDYILRRGNQYYAGGSFGSPKLTSNPDDAIAIHGAYLLDNDLWRQFNFVALELESLKPARLRGTPEPLGSVWTARAKLYDAEEHPIATCMDAPNSIAKAFMELPEAAYVSESYEVKLQPREAYLHKMQDWNIAKSGLRLYRTEPRKEPWQMTGGENWNDFLQNIIDGKYNKNTAIKELAKREVVPEREATKHYEALTSPYFGKEPYTLTKEQYIKSSYQPKTPYNRGGYDERVAAADHEVFVNEALSEGKLSIEDFNRLHAKDYPDLAAKVGA